MRRAFSPRGLWCSIPRPSAWAVMWRVFGPSVLCDFQRLGLCCFCVDSKIHHWYLCDRYLTCHSCYLKNLKVRTLWIAVIRTPKQSARKRTEKIPSCAASQMTGPFRMHSSIYFRHQKSRGFKVRKIHWLPGFARKLSTKAEPGTLSGGVR